VLEAVVRGGGTDKAGGGGGGNSDAAAAAGLPVLDRFALARLTGGGVSSSSRIRLRRSLDASFSTSDGAVSISDVFSAFLAFCLATP